jgi:hypothetical protein
MSHKKKTGLGETSLLLRRTTPPEAVHAADVAVADAEQVELADAQTSERLDVQDATDESDQAAIEEIVEVEDQPASTPRGTSRPKKLRLRRDKCTIYLEQDVNQLLTLAARAQNRERSEIVTDILRTHLPTYRIRITRTKA